MLRKGQNIAGQYQITDLIDTGGMSAVYRGYDPLNHREVAVKVLKRDKTSNRIDDIIRFQRETSLISKLSHPHLVQVYEVGEYMGWHYLVMELLNGESLSKYLHREKQLPLNDAVKVVLQLAEALDYVHSTGIIHRDLKPGNVFVVDKKSGRSNDEVKLLDFGLAQVTDLTQLNDIEEIVGTFSYMSPEQGGIIKKPVDERSDLYSLGIIFYELLTGELPFQGNNIAAILHQQIAKLPTLLRRIDKNIPPVIEEIVAKLLRKDPEERYQAAKGLLKDLRRFLQGEDSFTIGKYDRAVKTNYRIRLVGREEELKRLEDLFVEASEGRGSVCLISGEAGSGKSRLVEEMRRYAYEYGGEFIGGKSSDQEIKTPYQPFAEALNEYLDSIRKFSLTEKQNRLAVMKKSVGDLGEIICRLNSAMKEVLGDVPALVSLEPEKENLRFLMVCAKFFLQLGGVGRPVVIYLDDLHWADEGSLTLLGEIVEQVGEYPLLILGTYRDNEVTEKHHLIKLIESAMKNRFSVTEIRLSSLNMATTSKMIGEILSEEENGDTRDLSEFIFQKSQGNPFFTTEIVRQLVDENALINDDGLFQPQWEKIYNASLPTTIVDTLLRRVEGLKPEQIRLLTYGAVIGREFDINLLLNLANLSMATAVNLIDDGISLQLLEKSSQPGKILFAHDRVRDVFYQRISREERKRLHLEIAATLEKMQEKNTQEFVFELAHHFTEAGIKDKALQYSLPAAEKAMNSYANEEACRYYSTAINILEEKQQAGTPEWNRAKEGLLEVYVATGENEEAIAICRELLPLKETPRDKATVYRYMGTAYFKKGDWQSSEENFNTGLDLLGLGSVKGRISAVLALVKQSVIHGLHNMFPGILCRSEGRPGNENYKDVVWFGFYLGWIYTHTDVVKGIWSLLLVLNTAETHLGQSEGLVIGQGGYAITSSAIPLFNTAEKYFQRSMILAGELNYKWGIAQCLQWQGTCITWQGYPAKGREYIEQSVEQFESIGDMWQLGMSCNMVGHAYRVLSEYKKAIESYSRYLAISQKIHDDYGVSSALASLTCCYCESGEFEKAEECGKKAVNITEEKRIRSIDCYAYINYGYLQKEQRKIQKAIGYLERARILNESNTYLQEYCSYLYSLLADAYMEDLKTRKGKVNNKAKILQKIRETCKKALKATKKWKNHYGGALRVNGKYYALINNCKKAEEFFNKSINHCKLFERPFELAKGYYEYALFLESTGQNEKAKEYLQKGFDLFRKIGAGAYVKKIRERLPGEGNAEFGQQESDLNSVSRGLSEKLEKSGLQTLFSYLSSIQEWDFLMEKIMDVAMETAGAERGFLLLCSGNSEKGCGSLEIKVSRNIQEESLEAQETLLSRTIVKKVEETREPVIVNDAGIEENFRTQMSVAVNRLRSVMCLPLVCKGKMLGLLYLENRLVGGLFSQEKLEHLNPVAVQAAIAIENLRLYDELQEKVKQGLQVHSEHEQSQSSNALVVEFMSMHDLTAREREILPLLLEGLENIHITSRLHISANTLKTHTRNIYNKMMVANRRELLLMFLEYLEHKTGNRFHGRP